MTSPRGWLGARLTLADIERDQPLDAVQAVVDTDTLLRLLAGSLRDVHGLEPSGCPFDRSTARLVDLARDRVRDDLADGALFDAPYQRYTPAELFNYVERSAAAHLVHDSAVILGDARLEGFWMRASGDEIVSGGTDTVGVGDPARDLATLSIDLVAGGAMPEVLGRFYEHFGTLSPDVARIDFHVLLDQLLR